MKDDGKTRGGKTGVKPVDIQEGKRAILVVREQRNRIVLEHLPLVKAIAVRVHENLPVHVDLDDLVHAGILGLIDATTKFNPDKQVVFSSYAKHRIKGSILDSLRQLDWASRDMRRRFKQIEAVTRELAAEKLEGNPTESEIANKLGIDIDRLHTLMLDLRNVGLVSASTRPNENEDLPAPDFPAPPDTHPDRIAMRAQQKDVVAIAMRALPERYQKVMLLYYTNEMTMKEIGNVLGINESRVSQIHKSALEKMQTALRARGIENADLGGSGPVPVEKSNSGDRSAPVVVGQDPPETDIAPSNGKITEADIRKTFPSANLEPQEMHFTVLAANGMKSQELKRELGIKKGFVDIVSGVEQKTGVTFANLGRVLRIAVKARTGTWAAAHAAGVDVDEDLSR